MIKAFKKLPFYNHIPATWKRTVREHFFIPCVRAFSRMWANVFLFATTPVRYTLSGPASLQDLPSMLICCANGLYLLDAGAIKQLLKGWYFGLTKHNGKYYVYERMHIFGRILQFEIEDLKIKNLKVFMPDLPKDIHQIMFIGDLLYILDTANNRIACFDENARLVNEAYPLGKLDHGKESLNYGHMNSLFPYKGSLYVLAHNNTARTGKKSSIIVLDPHSFVVKETLNDIGECAHNIIILDGTLYYCDSLPGKFMRGNETIISLDYYVRGLAMNEEGTILGGSRHCDRKDRKLSDSFIIYLDRDFRPQTTVTLFGAGACNEIRLIGKDLGAPAT